MSVVVARALPWVSARPRRAVVVRPGALLSRDQRIEGLALALYTESVRRFATYDYPAGARCISAASVLLGESVAVDPPARRVVVAGRPS